MSYLALSVIIIAKNEEERIGLVLNSLPKFIKEVIVVDSGSSDATCEIATDMGARVLFNEWTGFGPQKRFAEEQCSSDWLLNLDADEVLSDKSRLELENLFQINGDGKAKVEQADGYHLKINTVYAGDIKPRPFANDFNPVRLYRLSSGRYRNHPVYDRVVFEKNPPVLKQLHGIAYHYTFTSWTNLCAKADALIKMNTTNDDKKRSLMGLLLRLILSFPTEFLKYYIARRHIFGGYKGIAFSAIWSWYRSKRLALLIRNHFG